MMRLGQQRYGLVRSQSGFQVTLNPTNPAYGPQAWQLDLHYVPAETNPQPRPFWECEYLELCFQPFRYQTADWRKLSDFGPGLLQFFHRNFVEVADNQFVSRFE